MVLSFYRPFAFLASFAFLAFLPFPSPFGLASSSKGGQAKRKEEGGSSVGLSLPPKGDSPFSHRPKGFEKRKEEERREEGGSSYGRCKAERKELKDEEGLVSQSSAEITKRRKRTNSRFALPAIPSAFFARRAVPSPSFASLFELKRVTGQLFKRSSSFRFANPKGRRESKGSEKKRKSGTLLGDATDKKERAVPF